MKTVTTSNHTQLEKHRTQHDSDAILLVPIHNSYLQLYHDHRYLKRDRNMGTWPGGRVGYLFTRRGAKTDKSMSQGVLCCSSSSPTKCLLKFPEAFTIGGKKNGRTQFTAAIQAQRAPQHRSLHLEPPGFIIIVKAIGTTTHIKDISKTTRPLAWPF